LLNIGIGNGKRKRHTLHKIWKCHRNVISFVTRHQLKATTDFYDKRLSFKARVSKGLEKCNIK
jgi:hypothetical protein